MTCPGLLPDTGFVGGVLNYVDCQAQAIGTGGYQMLTTPGSTLRLVMTALLTIFVAMFGYRMLLGRAPLMRDGVLALAKIGIVLALATNWAAYRTLVYDVALNGPAELASDIGRPAGIPGSGGGLVSRLDNADQLMVALADLGEGNGLAMPAGAAPPSLAGQPSAVTPPTALVGGPPQNTGFSTSFAFGGARVLYLAGAAGALAALRLIAGVLLALGPFFFAFLLFDGTRGLFEGWFRVLAGAALGALGTSIALGVELALIEPRLANWLALRTAGYSTPGAAVELMVVTLIFVGVLIAIIIASARVAYGFRFPPAWRAASTQLGVVSSGEKKMRPVMAREPVAAAERSRAAGVADAVAASQRREAGSIAVVADMGATDTSARSAARPGASRDMRPQPPRPLGQSYRRTRNRASASAGRRERGA